MASLFKSDIFFFITSVVVIAIGIGLGIVIFYIINILRDVKDVSKTVKKETAEIAQDISQMRTKVKSGNALMNIFSFFKGLFSVSKNGRNYRKKIKVKKKV